MPDTSLENITGKDWTREVGSIAYEKEQVRANFYKKRAEFKLQTPNLDDVLNDPAKAGFKTLKELEDGPVFAEVKVKAGDSLFKILDAYFKGQGAGDKSQKETYLSLHYLNTQKETGGKNINVDYLMVGETVKIEKGRFSIMSANGTERIKDALLRPAAAVVEPPPAPVEPAPGPAPQPPAPEPPPPGPAPAPGPAPEPLAPTPIPEPVAPLPVPPPPPAPAEPLPAPPVPEPPAPGPAPAGPPPAGEGEHTDEGGPINPPPPPASSGGAGAPA